MSKQSFLRRKYNELIFPIIIFVNKANQLSSLTLALWEGLAQGYQATTIGVPYTSMLRKTYKSRREQTRRDTGQDSGVGA